MKKTVILVIIGFLMSAVLFAEEPLAYKVTTTSEVYKQIDNKGKVEYDITITLNKGDIVYSKGKVKSDFIRSTLDYVFMMILAEPYDGYEIQVKNLSPINTENVFGKEIFIDYPPDRDFDDGFFLSPGDVKEMWVPGYYCSVLKSKDRETLLKFNSTVVVLSEIKGGQSDYWYGDDRAGIRNGRCMFYNAAIKIGEGTNFLVKNIKKTEYGYAVNCVESASDYRDKEGKYRTLHKVFQDTSEFWEKYKPSDEMTLYLYLDGDYMDIYVDGKDLHLGTIVKVKKEFIEEYQSLIRFNTCDLSRITSWPRRADGSMDYPSLATDTNTTEETENYDDSAIAEFAKEKPTNKGSGVKIIMIAGIAVLLGGGAAAFLIKHRK